MKHYGDYIYTVGNEKKHIRLCRKCGVRKEISNFYTFYNNIMNWCKECIEEYSMKHKRNKDDVLTYEDIIAKELNSRRERKDILFLFGNGYTIRNKTKKMSSPGFLNTDITGICAMCGEILLFGTYHHILGDQSNFVVMLCSECHLTDGNMQVNYHCSSIGRRIESGALCWY